MSLIDTIETDEQGLRATLYLAEEASDAFCRAARDRNPVHQGPNGIAPGSWFGLLGKRAAAQRFSRELRGAPYAGQKVTFRNPVPKGSRLSLKGAYFQNEGTHNVKLTFAAAEPSEQIVATSEVVWHRKPSAPRENIQAGANTYAITECTLSDAHLAGLDDLDDVAIALSAGVICDRHTEDIARMAAGRPVLYREQEIMAYEEMGALAPGAELVFASRICEPKNGRGITIVPLVVHAALTDGKALYTLNGKLVIPDSK